MNEEKIYYQRHLPHYQPPDATMFVTFRLHGSLPKKVIEQIRFEKEMFDKEIKRQPDVNQRERLLKEHRILYFEKFDNFLDTNKHGHLWLRDARAASIVKEAIHYRDRKVYDLFAYCIMPNHVHMVFSIEGFSAVGRAVCPTYSATDSVGQTDRPTYGAADSVGRTDRPTYGATNSVGRAVCPTYGATNSVGRAVCPTYGAAASVGQTDRPTYIVTEILRKLKWNTALKINRLLGRSGAFWQDESYDHVVRAGKELERIIWYILNNPVKAGFVKSWEQWQWTYVKPGLL
ncbi:MAG: hypothetical protein QME52_08450 [Bacteroidota bacterium]|nr:hypothetical protein [Bacteroidota bacterium]